MSNKIHTVPIEPTQQSAADLAQYDAAGRVFELAKAPTISKIESFPRFASRPALSRFISRYEVFKKILPITGSIVECGVFHGAGLFSFAKISSILEPTNHSRRIIGFDTFSGFSDVHAVDRMGNASTVHKGGFCGSTIEDIEDSIALFDMNRPLSHIPKVEVISGDICVTAARYVEENPHLVVSLLNLDLDLYEPTRAAIEAFLPCMPKGAIIVFDELNARTVPGETLAVKELLGIRSLRIERFPHDTYFSFAVLD